MHWQADADDVIRCPTAGCLRYWKATRPLPAELKFPMLHTANGMPKCPGCALVYRSNASLYSHYADQSKRGDTRHPGRVCAAVPKNLLSSDQQEELRQHWQSCKQAAERTKSRYVVLIIASESVASTSACSLLVTGALPGILTQNNSPGRAIGYQMAGQIPLLCLMKSMYLWTLTTFRV